MNHFNNPINDAIDHFLNHSLSDVFGVTGSSNHLPVNIYEDNETHFIDVSIPGIPKENLSMTIEGNKLHVKTNVTDDSADEKEDEFIRRAFNYGKAERSFTIPVTADINRIKAEYLAGILKISIAKKEEAVEKGPIDIEILG